MSAEPPITHSYLVVGARGSVEDEARRLAASIVSPHDDRTLDLAMRGRHPDIVEFEPVARTYSVRDDVRARILPEAHRSPIEGDRKVVVLLDAERLDDAANALLKTLEEPPRRTHFVLVTCAPDELLETVRSRCRRVEVSAPSDAEIGAVLAAEGVAADTAAAVASVAGGQLARARAFAGRLAPVREAFLRAASELDGAGASVAIQSGAIQEAVQTSLAQLEADHDREIEELAVELEEAGYPERTATAQRRRVEERHQRATRKARTDTWLEGIAVLESAYRDSLVPERPRNLDREPPTVRPTDAAAALDACRSARRAFEFNPNEALLLERLLLQLPAAR